MTTHTTRARLLLAGVAALGMLGVAACGDDGAGTDDAADTTTTSTEGDTTTTTTGDDDELAAVCAVAQEIADLGGLPTPDQVARYQAAAPEEIQGAITLAGDAVVAGDGDIVATLAAFADDDVEAAIAEINTFESENCGIDYEASDLTIGEQEPEAGAAVVDVTATDYAFAVDEPVPSGRVSFVLRNQGGEAHLMGLLPVAPDEDVEAALVNETQADSGLAAPGGDDVEVMTADLEPGDYALVCFLPDADGTPHVFLGMSARFTVAA